MKSGKLACVACGLAIPVERLDGAGDAPDMMRARAAYPGDVIPWWGFEPYGRRADRSRAVLLGGLRPAHDEGPVSAPARIECPRCRRNIATLPTSPTTRMHKCGAGQFPDAAGRGAATGATAARRQLELSPMPPVDDRGINREIADAARDGGPGGKADGARRADRREVVSAARRRHPGRARSSPSCCRWCGSTRTRCGASRPSCSRRTTELARARGQLEALCDGQSPRRRL